MVDFVALVTPPKLLGPTGKPANGDIYVRSTSNITLEGGIVTPFQEHGKIIDGEFKDLDGGPLMLAVTPEGVALDIYVELVQDGPGGRRDKHRIVRSVSTPNASTVTWDALVDVVAVVPGTEYEVPAWVTQLLTDAALAAAPAIDAKNAAVAAAELAIEAAASVPTEAELTATIGSQIAEAVAGISMGGQVGELSSLPVMSKPPVMTMTKTADATPAIASPRIYPATDPAFRFTGNGPGLNGIYAKNAVGSATAAFFEWWSDAPLMDIRLNGSNLQGSLFVDGQLASLENLVTDVSGADYRLTVDFAGVSKPRRFRFWGVNLLFGGIRIGGEFTAWRPNEIRPFAWGLGDSYMFGNGAVPTVQSAFNVMCHNLGIDGLNDGVGGAGWTGSTSGTPQARLAAKLATLTRVPNYVFLDMGFNNSLSDIEAVKTGFNESVALVRSYCPDAQIIVFGPATPVGPTANLTTVRNALAARSAALNVVFIDVEGIVTAANKSRYTGEDNTHPNQLGHIFIGQRKAILARPALSVASAAPTPDPAPTFYGLSDYDHLYPLSSLSLADGAALAAWPDSGSTPDPLVSIGTSGGSFGTSVFESDEGGFVRLVSTAGNSKLLATTSIQATPRTTILVCRGSKGRQVMRVGGALLTRVGVTGEYQLTASGAGSGAQHIESSVNTDGWVCLIVRTEPTVATMFVNGVKTTAGTWVAGAATTLRLQTNEADPADFKFAASVPRIITDGEAADIYAALKVVYPVLA